LDIDILKQIGLCYTRMLIIEWNGEVERKRDILDYCKGFGMQLFKQNGENLILTK
jgi:hypothetical protein